MAKIKLEDGTVVYGEKGDKGYCGTRADYNYNLITKSEKERLKELIDMDWLVDAKEVIEVLLKRLEENKKEVTKWHKK